MTAVTPSDRRAQPALYVATMPLDVDESRLAILEAARRLLAEEGAGALTVRRIVAESGGSTMNVYSRFGGKNGVVQALFIEGFARLTALMATSAQTEDPLVDLYRCAMLYRRFALENRTYYGVMFEGAVPDLVSTNETKAAAMGALGMLAAAAQRTIDAGALVHENAQSLAADLWATFHGIVSLELRPMGPPDCDWPARYSETTAALLRGFTPIGMSAGPHPD